VGILHVLSNRFSNPDVRGIAAQNRGVARERGREAAGDGPAAALSTSRDRGFLFQDVTVMDPSKEISKTMRWNRILAGAILATMILPGGIRAGQITNLQLYDGTSGSPIVTVYYSNADGSGRNSAETYADPQVSGGTTAPIYYCVDLWHDNYLGSSYTITPVAGIAYGTSTFADVDNRIAWLLAQPQATVDERAAVQLAIWYTTDNLHTTQFDGFSFTGGDAALVNDYDTLIRFTGYNPSISYTAQFWDATHDPGNMLYQNMVTAAPRFVFNASVPEPDGRVLAGIGVLAVWGLSCWRRRRIAADAARGPGG
jgi:Thioester domain